MEGDRVVVGASFRGHMSFHYNAGADGVLWPRLGSVFTVRWINIAQVGQLPVRTDPGPSPGPLIEEHIVQMQIIQYPKHCGPQINMTGTRHFQQNRVNCPHADPLFST